MRTGRVITPCRCPPEAPSSSPSFTSTPSYIRPTTRGVDLSKSRSVPLALAAPLAAIMDRTARLLRRESAPPLTNWLVSFTGRDRSYDITAARKELGYSPEVTLEKGLAEMSQS